jgi:ABC-type enterochelin transport system ATPase subunit
LTEAKHVGTEMVRVEISVLIQRDIFMYGDEKATLLTFDKVHCSHNELTAEEKDRIVSETIESYRSNQIINGMIEALSGKSSRL